MTPLASTCGTLALLASGPAVTLQGPMPPPGEELAEREALDGVVGSAASQHFVYKWGADFTPSQEQIDTVLDGLEAAWDTQFVGVGLEPPPGSDVVKLNVYQASSGVIWDGQEIVDIGGGLTGVDPAGWPMLAFDRGIWDDDPIFQEQYGTEPGDLVTAVLAHELQHASQMATGAFSAQEHIWFHEGLSQWAVRQQLPGTILVDGDILHLAAAPQLPWQWFDVALYTGQPSPILDTFPPEVLRHIFGTWVLLEHVADELGTDAVAELALGVGTQAAPLDQLDAMLALQDRTLIDALAASWGKARTNGFEGAWAAQDSFESTVDDLTAVPGFEPLAGVLSLDGAQVPPPEHLAPARYGMNRWVLPNPPDKVVVDLDGGASGSEGTPTDWRLVAIVDRPDEAPDDWFAIEPTVPFDVPSDAEDLELFVVTGGETFIEGETFDYAIAVSAPEAAGADEPSAVEPGGCCSTAPSPSGAAVLLLVLPLAQLRRRVV